MIQVAISYSQTGEDADKAARMFNKAVSMGYKPGAGQIQNEKDIDEWIKKSAENGDAESQNDYGIICEMSGKQEEAFAWFLKSAKQGFVDGEFNLARCFEMGIGTKENPTKATEFLIKSGNKGHKNAQVMLGFKYLNGIGVEKNKSEAKKWFKLASEQGDGEAKAYLLECN